MLLECINIKYSYYIIIIYIYIYISLFLSYCGLPGWTPGLCLFVKVHQTTEVDSKLQQHSQHRIKVEDVW